MAEFQIQIQKYIKAFAYHIIKSSGQWVNKPKFHMLLHLDQSILRFGPAPLFATEKFESYNGVVRIASTHTNRQAPGRDIAIKFADALSLRFIFSGGILYDRNTGSTSASSPGLLNVFWTNAIIQKSMGYNQALSNAIAHYPFHKKVACKHEDQAEPPTALKRWLNDREFVQILDLQLNKHEAVEKDCFILTENPETRIRYIGFVNSLWKVSSNYYVNVTKLSKLTIHPFYGMREFIKTSDSCSFDSKAILAILNFQHNCFDADCPIKNTKTTRVERQDTTIRTAEVCHTNKTNFILNSASFHAPDYHREMADLFVPTIQPSEMAQAIDEGYDKWMHPDEIITPNQESETTSSSDAEIDENLELEDTPSLESTSESSELLDM
ncbi:hypothetical protein Pst134EA_028032 [Puccinia striiformis f. sp. tritici]|uniref:hypothetical protein n=1 Tax=Puccinia striiformis f. sp. tritici TaxID=168172 RepID=UPI002008EA6E|nr:hypothetical protein Pst134EA_028032 [Puccinia striiformis f. sp. tritici]KAH9448739.1 hypothetical protein Pst134EA_028032 [Puccinia striiformis f. sp. tritici]